MQSLYTFSGYGFVGDPAIPSTPFLAQLQVQGSDDLTLIATAASSLTAEDGSIAADTGSLFDATVTFGTGNPLGSGATQKIVTGTVAGLNSQALVIEDNFNQTTYVFALVGPDLVSAGVPGTVDVVNFFSNASLTTAGQFAPGTAWAPSAATSVTVNTDPFSGTPNADILQGFPTDDLIEGLDGNDNINGGFGNDIINGGPGGDTIDPEGGNDIVNSGPPGDPNTPPENDAITLDSINTVGGGLDIVRQSVADFDGDRITGIDFGDVIVIQNAALADVTITPPDTSGTPDIPLFGVPQENTITIQSAGASAPTSQFTLVPTTTTSTLNSTGPTEPISAPFVASQAGSDVIIQLDPDDAPNPGIGTTLENALDFSPISSALISDNRIQVDEIFYVGAIESFAILEDGHAINDISGEIPREVVGIDKGVFLSSGGGPGTENTESNFSVDLVELGDPRLDQTAVDAFPTAGPTFDASVLTFTFDASNIDLTTTPSIQFDVFFGSDEFPEFVNSEFVDIATIYVNGVNYALFNNDPQQPLSIVGPSINTPGNFFDSDVVHNQFEITTDTELVNLKDPSTVLGNVLTDILNLLNVSSLSELENLDAYDDSVLQQIGTLLGGVTLERDNGNQFTSIYDTEYDGFSVLLSVLAPIQAGMNEVVIAVADTGDEILDSGLFVGNVRGSDFAAGGSFVIDDGSSEDDVVEANIAPQLISLEAGSDVVTGTADELDGDFINGFGNDDKIIFEATSFTEDDLTVTLGSAILDVDTNDDGQADTKVTLIGDFNGANFAVADDGQGNTEITASNVSGQPEPDNPEAPVAVDDTATTKQGEAVTLQSADLVSNDTDANGDPLTIAVVGTGVNGTPVLSQDGSSVTFTPDSGFFGSASFEYTVSDGNGGLDIGKVDVTVEATFDGRAKDAPGTAPTDMSGIRDFDGNDLGGADTWKLIGEVDIQFDGDAEYIYVNPTIERWATVGPDANGNIDFSNHGQGGDTRVVGIYIDPLVESGEVVAFSDFDSQRRFQNDLAIDNLTVIDAFDFDGDGFQEIYFKVNDGTAYLRALMHADGNIQYANYQNAQQVEDYLTGQGFGQDVLDTILI